VYTSGTFRSMDLRRWEMERKGKGLVALHDIVLLLRLTLQTLFSFGWDRHGGACYSIGGKENCYISFRAGTGSDRAPVAWTSCALA
jgi:hypothetical protein